LDEERYALLADIQKRRSELENEWSSYQPIMDARREKLSQLQGTIQMLMAQQGMLTNEVDTLGESVKDYKVLIRDLRNEELILRERGKEINNDLSNLEKELAKFRQAQPALSSIVLKAQGLVDEIDKSSPVIVATLQENRALSPELTQFLYLLNDRYLKVRESMVDMKRLLAEGELSMKSLSRRAAPDDWRLRGFISSQWED
jgi:chromosome segregation ATPase